MALSFVSQASANADSITLPTHAAGDIIVIFAYNADAATTPTVPGTFTVIDNPVGANSNAHACGYLVAASSSEVSGTWTNADQLIAHVYRGQHASPIGGKANATNIAAVTYPAITMSVGDGTSWVLGFAGIRIHTQPLETPPTGMTNRSDLTIPAPVGEVAGHDTNGGVSSWAAAAGGGTGSRYRTLSIELIAAAGAPSGKPTHFMHYQRQRRAA